MSSLQIIFDIKICSILLNFNIRRVYAFNFSVAVRISRTPDSVMPIAFPSITSRSVVARTCLPIVPDACSHNAFIGQKPCFTYRSRNALNTTGHLRQSQHGQSCSLLQSAMDVAIDCNSSGKSSRC